MDRQDPEHATKSASGAQTVVDPRASFALWLRTGRAHKNLSLEDVARITKIQPRILEKLESGRLDGLPAEVFVRGFVRCFARCVGLDEAEALDRYGACTGTAPSVARAFVETLVPAPRSSAPVIALVDTSASASAPPAAAPAADAPAAADAEVAAAAPTRAPKDRTRNRNRKRRARADARSRGPSSAPPSEAIAAEAIAADAIAAEAIAADATAADATAAVTVAAAESVTGTASVSVTASDSASAPDSVSVSETVSDPVTAAAAATAADSATDPTPALAPPLPEIIALPATPWIPTMPATPSMPSVPWRRGRFAASASAPVTRRSDPRLVIDDADPDSAEREQEARAAAAKDQKVSFLPPILLDRDDRSQRQGGLTLAVILLLVAATLTLSYLMRRPSTSGDGVTLLETPSLVA